MNKENRKEFEQAMLSQANMLLGAVETLSWKYEGENSKNIAKEELQKDLVGLNGMIEFLEKNIGATKFQLPYIRYPEFAKEVISKTEKMLESMYKTKNIIEELEDKIDFSEKE